jgi:DNA topoisomerase I
MPPLRTYQQAQTWLANRTNVPTVLGSRALALSPDFPASAKAQSFYSAKVSEGHILDALRAEIDGIVSGTTDIASARMRLKTFLGTQGLPLDDIGWTDTPPTGVTEEQWKAHKKVTNLGSTRRLDLILKQNAGMAHAVGRREVSMDPDIRDRWPYFRYISALSSTTREDHAKYHDLVLPKTHPFWATHTGPWDYNCYCDIEDADQEEADQVGLSNATAETVTNVTNGETIEITDNPSGYTFDITAAGSTDPNDYDWATIQDTALGKTYKAEQAKLVSPKPKKTTRKKATTKAKKKPATKKPKAVPAKKQPKPPPDPNNFYGMDRTNDLSRVQTGTKTVTAKSGKTSEVPVFEWRKNGKAVADELGERATKMRLPPSWTDVHVAADPTAKLQALGLDSKGRVQRRYSAEFMDQQAKKKFIRVGEFSAELPKMRRKATAARKAGRPESFVFELEDRTGIRLGNPRDVGAKTKAFGITTLEGRHVAINGNKITLDFIGKEGIPFKRTLKVSDETAAFVKARKAAAADGDRLWPDVSGAKLNKFVKETAGGKPFSVKDFRTSHATRLALAKLKPLEGQVLTAGQRKAAVKAASERAADFLNNGASMAKNNYIDPSVWDIIGGDK